MVALNSCTRRVFSVLACGSRLVSEMTSWPPEHALPKQSHHGNLGGYLVQLIGDVLFADLIIHIRLHSLGRL